MIRHVALLTVIAVLCGTGAIPRAPKAFWMKRFDCLDQPNKHATVMRCQVENRRNNPQMLHVVVNISHLVPKMFITSVLYAKQQQSQTLMYDSTLDYCQFMAQDKKDFVKPVDALLYNYAKHNYPHLLIQCPIIGIFNVTNLQVDRNLVPPFATPGTYIATQRFFNKRNESVFHFYSEFVIGVTSIFNQNMTMIKFR